ncbi:hypothetical protein D9M68_561050 [compost metagenome]
MSHLALRMSNDDLPSTLDHMHYPTFLLKHGVEAIPDHDEARCDASQADLGCVGMRIELRQQ